MEELREKIEKTNLSEEARKKAQKELQRMEKMSVGSPELGVIRSYLDWILSLPWGVETQDNMDLIHAAKVLNDDHYGLEKVKERIVEYLAVRKMKNNMRGPILCFVGPAGRGQDLRGALHRAGAGPQICAHLAGGRCATRRRSAGTGAPISAPSRGGSSPPSSRPAP